MISPIVRITHTNHAGFVIRELDGENIGRVLLADLNALRDNYRRQLFRTLQARNDAPVPYLVGTVLRVSGSLERTTAPGQPAVQFLVVTELNGLKAVAFMVHTPGCSHTTLKTCCSTFRTLPLVFWLFWLQLRQITISIKCQDGKAPEHKYIS